jgi:hypothetical protein
MCIKCVPLIDVTMLARFASEVAAESANLRIGARDDPGLGHGCYMVIPNNSTILCEILCCASGSFAFTISLGCAGCFTVRVNLS